MKKSLIPVAYVLIAFFSGSTASAQPFDDEPFDPIAVENGTAGWFPSIYGPDDQLGTLNEVTPEKTLEALRMIKSSKKNPPKTYNLGEIMEPGINAFGSRVYDQVYSSPPNPGPFYFGENELNASEESINTTYQIATQVDGLPHIGVRSVFYNGFTAENLVAGDPSGADVLGQELVDPFITRGILLDVLAVKIANNETEALGEIDGITILADSYRITVEDLLEAMAFGDIDEIRPGDVVIMRTGWSYLYGTDPGLRNRYIGAEPGIYLREARWLAQFSPAIVASDGPALEVRPAPPPWSATQIFPVHQELLVHYGIRIGEAFNSEELSADGVYEFVFFYTPQRAKGATASNTAPGALGQPKSSKKSKKSGKSKKSKKSGKSKK